ncbi:hypothetical protein HPB50_007387 [Hyalomma asiaticum]|uniref:Uncharacterized protein n=1 Tax=Hyalomma asiaticum TaxID=266040 RepID=A0ACB7RYW6_HYAAI|nr:hypothetical protein HPB50_007387 [Hyalomma asiaticum]
MGDERSESMEFRIGNIEESKAKPESEVKPEVSEVPVDTAAEFAPLPYEGMCLPSQRNIALMAAVRSQELIQMQVSTFEDDVSDSSSDESERECDE